MHYELLGAGIDSSGPYLEHVLLVHEQSIVVEVEVTAAAVHFGVKGVAGKLLGRWRRRAVWQGLLRTRE